MVQEIKLEVLASPGCHVCRMFEEYWQGISRNWPNVSFKHFDVTTPEGQEVAQKYMIFASPGIILNGEVWATGGFDKNKFIERLKELS
jgi:thiol-disulfide isomerase/thioredoxin